MKSFIIFTTLVGFTVAVPFNLKAHASFAESRVEGKNMDVVRPINNMVNRVLTSETAEVLDNITSSIANLIGNIAANVGSFIVTTADQLPLAFNTISRTVNSAVSNGGEKVVVMVKELREDPSTPDQVLQKIDKSSFLNTEVHKGIQNLQDEIAKTFGMMLAIAYKNADQIDNAVATTLRKVTGLEESYSTSSYGKTATKSSTLTDAEIKANFPSSDDKTTVGKISTLSDAEIAELFTLVE